MKIKIANVFNYILLYKGYFEISVFEIPRADCI